MNVEHRDRIKRASDGDQLRALLAGLDRAELTGRDLHIITGSIDRCGVDPDLRIAYAGNHTLEPLPAYVRAHAAVEGIWLSHCVGSYDQYFQEALDPGSEIVRSRPDVLLLSLLMRRLAPRVHDEFGALSESELDVERSRIVEHVREWAAAATRSTDALVLVTNFPRPPQPRFGVADGKLALGESEFYLSLNLELLQTFKHDRRVHVFDLDRLVADFGHARAASPRMYHLAKMPWTEDFQACIAQEMLRYLIAVTGRGRKCVAVDLDNTLWSGVAGEDGVEGIRIGVGDAVGEAHLDLQYALKSLKHRGVVLAINSKNNPEDVEEIFRHHSNMPLALEDFSVSQINWDSKLENLQAIARTLNVGTDSLAFVDDNPAECALIGEAMPEVATIRLHGDPAGFADQVRRQIHFERLTVTDEDRRKARQYSEHARRQQAQSRIPDLSTYLRSLGLEVAIRPGHRADIPRIHQLFNKTNQFNVTTRRYSVADVERFLSEPGYDLRLAAAKDNFGDLGIIGLALACTRDETCEVDSFLMSCRALGRGIEAALMNCVKEIAARRGAERIKARFDATAKNAPARDFFESQGFRTVRHEHDSSKTYELLVSDVRPVPCPHIKLVVEEVARE